MSNMHVTTQCPRCSGKVTFRSDAEGAEVLHTLPLCASFETIRTLEDATALITELRETRQRELGLPLTDFVGEA